MLPEASAMLVADEVCGGVGCLTTKCKVSPFSTSKTVKVKTSTGVIAYELNNTNKNL